MKGLSFYEGKVLGGWVERHGIGTLLKLVANNRKPGAIQARHANEAHLRRRHFKLINGGRI